MPGLADFSLPAASSATNINGLTASQVLGTNASAQVVSLAVATYPSLAELAFIKGLTSAAQTQLNALVGRARISSGTYSGDNTGNRAIPHGLGVIPKFIYIINTNNELNTFSIVGGTGVIFFQLNTWAQSAVTAPDTTNFYVGNTGNPSTSANYSQGPRTYAWVAIG